jgi:hypothetical protein
MYSNCPRCGAAAPTGALGCDSCRLVFSAWASEEADRLKREADRLEGLSETVKKELVRRTVWSMWRWVAGLATLITLLIGGSAFGTLRYIQQQIAEQFAKPAVQRTLNEVAEGQAQRLIKESIEPQLASAHAEIERSTASLHDDVSRVRADFDAQIQKVSGALEESLAFFGRQQGIQELMTRAGSADYAALEQLSLLASTPGPDQEVALQAFRAAASNLGNRTRYIDMTFFADLGQDPSTMELGVGPQ